MISFVDKNMYSWAIIDDLRNESGNYKVAPIPEIPEGVVCLDITKCNIQKRAAIMYAYGHTKLHVDSKIDFTNYKNSLMSIGATVMPRSEIKEINEQYHS